MKLLIYTIVQILIFSSTIFSQTGWFQLNSGTSNYLTSICFVNSNTGWVAGVSGTILKTTDGGQSWVPQNSNTTMPINRITFADANTGWAVGGVNDPNPLCQDQVLKLMTTDGGENWIVLTNGFSSQHYNLLRDVSAVDNSTAYICSGGSNWDCMSTAGGIWKSVNSGLSWTNVSGLLFQYYFTSIYFLNANTGWAAGFRGTDVPPNINIVFRTTNAGASWDTLNVYSKDTWFYTREYIKFVDEYTGYAINSCLEKSTDGGFTWQNADSLSTANIGEFHFINRDTGWCTKGNVIIRTNDGGNNWIVQSTNTGSNLATITFVNLNTGWAAGTSGTILKTVSGGLTSVSNVSTSIPGSYTLFQNYPNPFNPVTKIKFNIPRDARRETQDVKLVIYDELGREIQTLVNQKLTPGSYETEFRGSDFASGVYFYKLEAGNFIEVKRMMLLK